MTTRSRLGARRKPPALSRSPPPTGSPDTRPRRLDHRTARWLPSPPATRCWASRRPSAAGAPAARADRLAPLGPVADLVRRRRHEHARGTARPRTRPVRGLRAQLVGRADHEFSGQDRAGRDRPVRAVRLRGAQRGVRWGGDAEDVQRRQVGQRGTTDDSALGIRRGKPACGRASGHHPRLFGSAPHQRCWGEAGCSGPARRRPRRPCNNQRAAPSSPSGWGCS